MKHEPNCIGFVCTCKPEDDSIDLGDIVLEPMSQSDIDSLEDASRATELELDIESQDCKHEEKEFIERSGYFRCYECKMEIRL